MYFHTNNPYQIAKLELAVQEAINKGKRLRINVDEQGCLTYKVGEGMWSSPMDSTPDPYRDENP